MRSRISIDVDWINSPVIKVDYVESDDLRDKMLGRFLYKANQTFIMKIVVDSVGPGRSTYNIVPVDEGDIEKEYKKLEDILHNREVTLGGILKDSEACSTSSPLKKDATNTCN